MTQNYYFFFFSYTIKASNIGMICCCCCCIDNSVNGYSFCKIFAWNFRFSRITRNIFEHNGTTYEHNNEA